MTSFALIIICCVMWMFRPGRRPHLFVLDILPWLCVAGAVASDGALSANLTWTAVGMVYFSVKYNRPESSATPADGGTPAAMC